MENVHVINMDKDVARFKTSFQLLDKLGYNVIRYPGIDATKIDLSVYNIGQATKGMIGCSLSHTGLMKKLLDSSLEYIIVAEDDVTPKRFASELKPFMKLVPNDYDLVQLGCEFHCSEQPTIQDRLMSITSPLPKVVKVNNEVSRIWNFSGSHFYIISRKGAKKLLDNIKNNHSHHIDARISSFKDIVIYSATRPFGHAALTGLCTDSNNFGLSRSNTSVKKELCLLDKIKISEIRTLGYALFLPNTFGFTGLLLSMFDVIILILLTITLIYFIAVVIKRKAT